MKTNWTFFLIIAFILAFVSEDVYSKESSSMDVVLVMDSSGSMKKTDPLSLRVPAAKLFISLLDKTDRASVLSFSDTSYPIINLTPVDAGINKEQLLRAADKISSAGLFTNLHDALNGGLEILTEGGNNGRSKVIVLMSDGMMDVGDANKDRELVDKIKNEMAATLEDKGIKVYTIAFTEQSDRLLLEKISKRTGGFYNLALSDKDFHLIFTSIFESLKSPDMLPMSENGFLIDGSIGEVTIVATKGSPQTQIRLNSPDGRSYSNKERSTGIGWFVSDNFDMITIKTPAEGRWDILFSTGENNKAYIITNLKLQTNFDQLYSTFGDPLDIKIWLEKDGIAIKEKDLLDKFDIYIELTGPDGKSSKLKPFNKGEGLFVRNIAPFTPGNYKLRIIAQGNTFEREKAFVFNVADARESKEDILIKREKGKKAEENVRHNPAEAGISNSLSWKKVIIQFVFINLAIGIMVLVYLKRKSINNVKGIINVVGSTRLMTLIRKKKSNRNEEGKKLKNEQMTQEGNSDLPEEAKREEEVKQGVREKQEDASVLNAKEVQKGPEGHAGAVQHKEEDAQIKEIPLEEDEHEEGNKIEEEKTGGQQETATGEQKQENVQQDINEDTVDNNQWSSIDSSQHILNQDDLNQLLGGGVGEDSEKNKEEQITGLKLEGPAEGHIKLEKETDNQGETDKNIQNEEPEDMDKLWQEALQSQKDAEAGEMTKGQEEQITALDMEIERLEQVKKEEISQLTGAEDKGIELTGRDVEKQKDESSGKEIEDNIPENQQEDIDAIWQEALQQQKAAEEETRGNKESMCGD